MNKLKTHINISGGVPVFAHRLGISEGYVYRVLRGEREPSKKLAKKILEDAAGSLSLADILPEIANQ